VLGKFLEKIFEKISEEIFPKILRACKGCVAPSFGWASGFSILDGQRFTEFIRDSATRAVVVLEALSLPTHSARGGAGLEHALPEGVVPIRRASRRRSRGL
jgi:hypothetical protein